jgi:hypothetical protein
VVLVAIKLHSQPLVIGPLDYKVNSKTVRLLPDGSFELEIVGAIAAMVALGQSAAGNKKSRPGGGFICSRRAFGKVVAGAPDLAPSALSCALSRLDGTVISFTDPHNQIPPAPGGR